MVDREYWGRDCRFAHQLNCSGDKAGCSSLGYAAAFNTGRPKMDEVLEGIAAGIGEQEWSNILQEAENLEENVTIAEFLRSLHTAARIAVAAALAKAPCSSPCHNAYLRSSTDGLQFQAVSKISFKRHILRGRNRHAHSDRGEADGLSQRSGEISHNRRPGLTGFG